MADNIRVEKMAPAAQQREYMMRCGGDWRSERQRQWVQNWVQDKCDWQLVWERKN